MPSKQAQTHTEQKGADRQTNQTEKNKHRSTTDDQSTDSTFPDYLASDHDCARDERHGWVFLEAVVHGDDVQHVHLLALVLVDSLHLHVKQRGWVGLHSVVLLDVGCQLHLVLLWMTCEMGVRVRPIVSCFWTSCLYVSNTTFYLSLFSFLTSSPRFFTSTLSLPPSLCNTCATCTSSHSHGYSPHY